MSAPLTWAKIGSLAGLSIIDCFARENPSYGQINVFYRVGEMRFAEPIEPYWVNSATPWKDVPAYTRVQHRDFRRCEVQLVIDTRFPFEIDEVRERKFADQLFTVWAMQSGYDNWMDERRHKGLEPFYSKENDARRDAEFDREMRYRMYR